MAGPDRILILAVVKDPGGAKTSEHLRRVLSSSGIDSTRVEVVRLEVQAVGPQQNDQIRQALLQTRPRVVVAMTMTIARSVQLIDSRVPIVFDGASDPRSVCLVDDLIRPGRNATGFTSHLAAEAKMLEVLLDAFPSLRHVVVLYDGSELTFGSCSSDAASMETASACRAGSGRPLMAVERLLPARAMTELATERGIALSFLELCEQKDMALAHRAATAQPSTGVVVPLHFLLVMNRKAVVGVLSKTPAIYNDVGFVKRGGLMALVAKRESESNRRAFELVARVLGGLSPSALPVERPNGFELYVNLQAIADPALRPSLTTLRRADHLLR